MTLFPRLDVAGISTRWPFRYPQPVKMSITYKYSFFPQTIRDWNDLPESLISSSELSDDSISKLTSLVRARDLFPPVTAPGEGLSIWRFTSKLFRFRPARLDNKMFCLLRLDKLNSD